MSFSSLLFFGACWGCYKLGSFNARYPGQFAEMTAQLWNRLNEWSKKSS